MIVGSHSDYKSVMPQGCRWIAAGILTAASAGCGVMTQMPRETTGAPQQTRPVSFETRQGTKLALDMSPDGATIVFDLLGQLWVMPATGGPARPITDAVRDTAVDLDPSFSPDGQWIVFQGERGRSKGIWLVKRDGTQLDRLTDTSASAAIQPAWSPDGRAIAYVLRDSIRIMDTGNRNVRTLRIDSIPAGTVRAPAWSPDGARIAFAHGSGRIMEVANAGGRATAVTPAALRASAPAYSPDGSRIAFFTRDEERIFQLWVQTRSDTAALRVTNHADITNLRVRWLPDGNTLLYSADGRLWRRGLSMAAPEEIGFSARVRFDRDDTPLRRIAFSQPGAIMPVRGHMGLSLSPDGRSIALIALGKLWVVSSNGADSRVVATMPFTASGLAWSPDARRLAWSSGPGGSEDLYITDITTGATRRFTALAGREERPSWSPDGRWIAFVHWPKPACDTPPSRFDDDCGLLRIRAARVTDSIISRTEDTRALTSALGFDWTFSFFESGQEVPQWNPASDGIFYVSGGRVWAAPLTGQPQNLGRAPTAATFVHVRKDSSMVYVRDNALWESRTLTGAAARVSDETALYPSVSDDGTILYLSPQGLRLRSRDGRTRGLGWPLSYTVPPAEPSLLVRGGRVIDGTGAPGMARDILIVNGRIARIADSASISAGRGTRVIDAAGRTVTPGLIDLHGHLWDDAVLPGALNFGVTTMREMGGSAARVAGFRDAIAAGVIAGPRLVLGGFQFYPGGEGTSGVVIQSLSEPASAVRGLELLRALGGEYVKLRSPMNQADGVALVAAARARGMRVSGHCAHTLPMVAAGMTGKEHLSTACADRSDGIWYDDLAQLFLSGGMHVVATTAAFASVPRVQRDTGLVDGGVATFVTPFLRWWARRLSPTSGPVYTRLAQTSRTAVAALRMRGVPVVPASDDPTFADALHWELEEFVAAGFSPLQAITAVTGGAARALGADRDIGTLEAGKLADLLILDADPLTDIRNTRRIIHVIQQGRVVDRAGLKRALEQ